MKQLEQPLHRDWWKRTNGTRAYQLREFSGILIAVWCLYFLNIPGWIGMPMTNPWYGWILNTLGLIGAILHTSSWLAIMPKLTPFDLTHTQQKILYITIILTWLAISAAILITLWL